MLCSVCPMLCIMYGLFYMVKYSFSMSMSHTYSLLVFLELSHVPLWELISHTYCMWGYIGIQEIPLCTRDLKPGSLSPQTGVKKDFQ